MDRPWTHADRERLRSVFAQSGRRGALDAFPDRSLQAIASALQRYAPTGRPAGDLWSAADVAKLRAAHASGSQRAAIAAFPDRSRESVRAAIRRYRREQISKEPAPFMGRESFAKAIAAIPYEQLIERVSSLLLFRADYGAPQ